MITIPGKIPIYIHPVFWLMAALIGWINSMSVVGTLIWGFVILISVLIHEYGHALTALAFGQKARIELVGFGGATHHNGKRLKLWQNFIIVLNGPLAGFLLFLAAYKVSQIWGDNPPKSYLTYFVIITMYANFFWTIVNLLPVYPLDGGHLFSIVLQAIFGLRGKRLAFFLSGILAVAISIAFFVTHAFLAGAIFLLLAFESYRAWKYSDLIDTNEPEDHFKQAFKEAEEEAKLGRNDEAMLKLEQIRNQSDSGLQRLQAIERLVQIAASKEDWQQVYDLADSQKDRLSPQALVSLQQAAFHLKRWRETIQIGMDVYRMDADPEVALLNAQAHSQLSEPEPAVGWLQRAIADGLEDPNHAIQNKEFDPIRSDPNFQSLVRTTQNTL